MTTSKGTRGAASARRAEAENERTDTVGLPRLGGGIATTRPQSMADLPADLRTDLEAVLADAGELWGVWTDVIRRFLPLYGQLHDVCYSVDNEDWPHDFPETFVMRTFADATCQLLERADPGMGWRDRWPPCPEWATTTP